MDWRKHWKAILGGLSVAYGVIRGLLDAIGYVDLVIAHEPGRDRTWLGHLTNVLVDPPIWALFPMVIVGLLLILWDIRRTPKPSRIASTAPVASLKLEVLRADSRVPLQDAMMYGLNKVWPKSDDKVKDGQEGALLIFLERARGLAGEGRLVVFGKLSKGHLPAAIPAHFWETNQFDYMSVVFQEPEESKTEPATLPAGSEVYHDLRVDKFQVERLWPKW